MDPPTPSYSGKKVKKVKKLRPYHCSECGNCYTRKGHLKRHYLIVHGGKRFTCPHCKLSYTRVHTLVKHLQRNRRCKEKDLTYFDSLLGPTFTRTTSSRREQPTPGPSNTDDFIQHYTARQHHPYHRPPEPAVYNHWMEYRTVSHPYMQNVHINTQEEDSD
jgi:uncharacterized Zn-finger protein